jgi:predicted nucleic acid-binding Zn ribbon protein
MRDRGSRDAQPERISSLLPAALQALGPKRLWTEVALRRCWPEAVGEEVANHAHVIRLRGACLEVGVNDEGWATELRYLATVLVEKLNEQLGEEIVREMVVRRVRNAPGRHPGVV